MKCASCGGRADKRLDLCVGCGQVVCLNCSTIGEHLGDGPHWLKSRIPKEWRTVEPDRETVKQLQARGERLLMAVYRSRAVPISKLMWMARIINAAYRAGAHETQ